VERGIPISLAFELEIHDVQHRFYRFAPKTTEPKIPSSAIERTPESLPLFAGMS